MVEVTTSSVSPLSNSPLSRFEKNRQARSQRQIFLQRLRANRLAVVGAVIIGILIFFAIFGPLVAPENPIAMNLVNQFQPPSLAHPFGTDDFGRDILSRVIYGARLSLEVGIVAVVISGVIGSVVGLVAGYFGGWVDMVSQRIIDVMLAFPGLLLALAIVAVLGPSLINVIIAVGIGSIPGYARLMRGEVLSLREKEYVEAVRAVGATDRRILFHHILPNALSPIIVLASLGIAGAILSAAALSFIGMGAQPPSPEWGAMLSAGRQYLRDDWWIATFPGIAISLTVLGFNVLGDGLRDALDPQGME
ncbi:MAG TPA: nickel transporter permease [Thermomicrobiaceae bacterium]|nr:nickel transporter permease [Thermomicrobiaceae bacterium]